MARRVRWYCTTTVYCVVFEDCMDGVFYVCSMYSTILYHDRIFIYS